MLATTGKNAKNILYFVAVRHPDLPHQFADKINPIKIYELFIYLRIGV